MKMPGLKHILTYRELLIELVKREIKARYKQSILGYVWVVLVPLMNLVVLSVVFSYFVRIPTGAIPYPMFLFAGLVPWMFTSNSIVFATSSLLANSSLITKIFLPREAFPLAAVLSKSIDFLLSMAILFVFMLYYSIPYRVTLIYLPLILLVHFLIIMGISFVLSALNVFYRDIENVVGIFITLWMYLTPVIYPQEMIPQRLIPIFNLNPMMPVINAYRNVILYNNPPSWQSFSWAAIFSVIIFVGGYLFFKKRSNYFADVI